MPILAGHHRIRSLAQNKIIRSGWTLIGVAHKITSKSLVLKATHHISGGFDLQSLGVLIAHDLDLLLRLLHIIEHARKATGVSSGQKLIEFSFERVKPSTKRLAVFANATIEPAIDGIQLSLTATNDPGILIDR